MAEQRELHRARQQRYRKKFNAKAYHLQEAVDQLREEIKQLSLRRQSIYTSIPTEMRPWKLVIEYFRVVRNGFKQETGQKAFLQRTMVPHVSFNGGYGINAVLEDWRMVSLHHEEMEIQLAVVKPDSENSLITWGDYSIGGHAKAVSSSPGGQFTLGFARRETATGDPQCCEVTRWIVHFKADMLIPLMKLLDNLQDAYR